MTSPNFLRTLAGVGIGLAVLFSFIALILSAETLRKINNTNDAITGATRLGSKGGKGPSTAVIADYVWKYGEASAACGDCVSSTLLAGQHTPSGTSKICNNATHLWVTVDMNDGFCWREIHIDVRTDCTIDNDHSPGLFNYKIQAPNSGCLSDTVTLFVSLAGVPVGSYFCIPIHLDTVTPTGFETSWAGCVEWGQAWAMYCEYNTENCPPPTLPPPEETPAPEGDCVWTCIPRCTGNPPLTTDTPTVPPLEECPDYKTFTQGGWGADCHGGNPGCFLENNWATCFDSGLTLGCSAGKTVEFTTAAAVNAFLPNGGTPGVFDASGTDVASSSAGVFAAQLLAAKLSSGFDRCLDDFSPCVNHADELCFNAPHDSAAAVCNGFSVANVIDASDRIIGGCSCLAPSYSELCSRTPAQLSACLDSFNNNYDNGNQDNGNFARCADDE